MKTPPPNPNDLEPTQPGTIPDPEPKRGSQRALVRPLLRLLRHGTLFLLLLLTTLVIALSIPSVQLRLVSEAIAWYNNRIQGRLELDALDLRWRGRAQLTGLRLLDPAGDTVLSLQDASIVYHPWDLWMGQVTIERLSVRGLHLNLKNHADGLTNLDRALAATHPSPAPPSPPWDGTLPLAIDLTAFSIQNCSFVNRSADNSVPPDLLFDDLVLEGSYSYARGAHELTLTRGTIDLKTPPIGTSAAQLALIYRRKRGVDSLDIRSVHLQAEGLEVDGSGLIENLETLDGDWGLSNVKLDPRFLEAFLDEALLRAPITGSIVGSGPLNKLALRVSTQAEGGTLELEGTVDLKGEGANSDLMYDLTLSLSTFDISKVLTYAYPELGPITGTVHAQGRGTDPARMDTELDLRLEALTYDAYGFDSLVASGHMTHNTLILHNSLTKTPYGRLFAHGQIGLEGPSDLTTRLVADDLASLGALFEVGLEGQGYVQAQLTGDIAKPEIQWLATASNLIYQSEGSPVAQVTGLTASGTVHLAEDSRGTYHPQVSLHLEARHLTASGAALDPLTMDVDYGQDRVDGTLEALVASGHPVRFVGGITLSEPMALDVRGLELPLGGASWSLSAPFQGTVAGDRITLSQVRLEGADGFLTVEGTYSSVGENDLTLSAEGIALTNLEHLLAEDLPGIRGRLTLNGRLTGPADRPQLTASLEVKDLASRDLHPLDLNLVIHNDVPEGKRLVATGEVHFQRGGEAGLFLSLPIAPSLTGEPSVRRLEALSGYVQLRRLALNQFHTWLGPEYAQLKGALTAHLNLGGSLQAPDVTLVARTDQTNLLGARLVDLMTQAHYGAGLARVSASIRDRRVGGMPILEARGQVPIMIGESFSVSPRWDEPMQATLEVQPRLMRDLTALHAPLQRVKGQVALELHLSGPLGAPQLRGTLRGRSLQLDASPQTNLDMEVVFQDGQAALTSRAQFEDQSPILLDLRLKAGVAAWLRGGDLSLWDLRASLDAPLLDLMVLPSDLRGANLRSGQLSLRATLDTQGAKPRLALEGVVLNLSSSPEVAHDIRFATTYENDALKTRIRIRQGTSTEARLEATLPLVLRLPLEGSELITTFQEGMHVQAKLANLDLAILNPFMPDQAALEGRLRGALTLTGSLDTPQILGKLWMTRGKLYMPSEGVYYDRIRARAYFEEDGIRLVNTEFLGAEGKLSLEGVLAMERGTPGALQGTARLANFTAMDGPVGRLVLDGGLAFGGTLDHPDVSGDLVVRSGVIKLPDFTASVVKEVAGVEQSKRLAPMTLPSTVEVLTDAGPTPWTAYLSGDEAQEETSTYTADIRVEMPRDFWIQNDAQEVVLEVKGDVRYLEAAGATRMEGEVEAVRGTLNLFSTPLELTQATITFTGGQEIDPWVSLEAEADVGTYGTVTLTVSGRASDPEIQFSSDAGYEYADVLALLIIGRPLSESTDPSEGDKVASYMESLAAGALSGWVQREMADKLPVDRIEIRASSFSSADLRVGKYITPQLFIIYRRWLGEASSQDENINEARMEYQLSKEFYIESFYGDAGIWGGEMSWKHMY